MTENELKKIENKVNEVIQSDIKVVEEFYPREEAEAKFNLSKLPDDATDRIRVIRIGDYDACPCSGLHVTHTKEIGRVKIISTSYDEGVLRVRFKLFEK